MIHRAILGSLERFMAIIIEHTGGRFPFWISPRQCRVVPINPSFDGYATEVAEAIFQAGFEASADVTGEKMNKKIAVAF